MSELRSCIVKMDPGTVTGSEDGKLIQIKK